MGLLKSAADLVYTFRFLRLLTTSFEDTDAFKYGIIDAEGNRIKSYSTNTIEARKQLRDSYTAFHRLVFNIKKLLAKAPGGSSKLASYASALYLMREHYGVTETHLENALERVGHGVTDMLVESPRWFVLPDGRLSPGSYKLMTPKVINSTMDELANRNDFVRVREDCYPVGELFGINIYSAIHTKTNQEVYVTAEELRR